MSSNGQLRFEKPNACPANACVEVARTDDGGAVVRNSENREATLSFTKKEWDAFTSSVRAGQFA